MPILHSTSSIRLAAFALLLAAPSARAQREPVMVPVTLVNALWGNLSAETGMAPRFTVGRAPADFPHTLIPGAPWTIVGGVAFGPLRATVFQGPRRIDMVTEYTSLVTRSGYRKTSFGDVQGGFVDGTRPIMYCADSTLLAIMPGDSTATTRTLLVHWNAISRGCEDGRMEGRHAMEIPPLRAPYGERVIRRSSGWGEDYVEQTAQLDTTTSVAATLDHYARLLGAAGWTVVGRPLVYGGAGMQQLSVRDSKGTQWEGVMLVITAGEQRKLTLRM
ncbi:MAG TPA: hypothetical protein VFI52_01060, partial [Gemmatimonadaceae bacterium]|nr:hypothetical protein [Gemmatimonadaceae bacterium]